MDKPDAITRGFVNIAAFQERYMRILPPTTDLTLLVLKGHLLIEEQLNLFLETELKHYSILKDARLTFLQKLKIVQSMCWLKKGTGNFFN